LFARFFRTPRPVDSAGKAWVEGRLRWMLDEFGPDPFLGRPPALPTTADFPELRGGATLQDLYARICERVGVDPARVPLAVVDGERRFELVDASGHETGSEAAHYAWDEDGERIRIQATQIGDPIQLIGTLAHELCHARLAGEGRVSGDDLDDELLTDLCADFHGFGLFLANAPRAWLGDCGTWPGTRLVRPAYMTVHLHAWALAHRALLAGERAPAWMAGLNREPRQLVRDGIEVLERDRDSAFQTGDWSAWNALWPGLQAPEEGAAPPAPR
jgi:hypothetical protein